MGNNENKAMNGEPNRKISLGIAKDSMSPEKIT